MNSDTIEGQGTNLGGQIKEGLGKLTGDTQLQGEGAADQLSGTIQQAVGKLRDFARERPVVAATLIGVLAIATLNTLRGRD